jgi:hypothetical protein
MQGLSLDQAPPYKIPLFYYIIATTYLLLFSLSLFFYGQSVEDRFYYESIAITHILTLGFFTHVMFGSLFQMVPVIIGESYNNVAFRAKIILIGLNIGIISFMLFFLFGIKMLMHVALLFLVTTLVYFSIYSFVTIYKTVDKNQTVKTFITALVFLAIGALFGLFSLLVHGGYIEDSKFGDIHFSIMIFGWIFLLLSGVAYKVIPMFYVAKEYPVFVKNYFYILVSVSLIGLVFATVYQLDVLLAGLKIVLALLSASFALITINILKNRKRKRGDTTINLWYFSMSNLLIASLLWIASILFDMEFGFSFGVIFGLGFVYALINGMLYKIIPFLTWFHLSSASVFEAEMSQVIKAKMMRIQFYIFIGSYIFFILALLYQPFLLAGATLFFISSAILLYNIIHGYRYYNSY